MDFGFLVFFHAAARVSSVVVVHMHCHSGLCADVPLNLRSLESRHIASDFRHHLHSLHGVALLGWTEPSVDYVASNVTKSSSLVYHRLHTAVRSQEVGQVAVI